MTYIENFLFSFTGISYFVVWLLVAFSITQKNKIFDFFASMFVYLFAFLFLGLRDQSSGSDTKNYIDYFLTGVSFSQIEPAFDLFTTFLRHLGNWEFYIFFNVAIQLIFISLICKILDIKYKAIVLLAYISFMPGFDMLTNGLRQGLASTVGMLIWVLAFYKNYIPKIFIVFVALFHKSMLAYIPLYFISRISNEKILTKLILYCFSLFVVILMVWHLADSVLNISEYTKYLSFGIVGASMTFGEKLNVYLTSEQNILSGIFKYYFLFLVILFQTTYFIIHKKLIYLNEYPSILKLALVFFYLSLTYAITWISPYSFRFMYISYLPGILLSLTLIQKYNSNKIYVITLVLILVAAVLIYGSKSYSNFHINI